MNPADPRHRLVIVGAGHAAAQLCDSLRSYHQLGDVTIIGDEPLPPYHRPPLSKAHLQTPGPDPTTPPRGIRPETFYQQHGITLRLGKPVHRIDRKNQTVHVGNDRLPYDTLVLATGSTHRRPPIPGIQHPRVFALRTAADADRLRQALAQARHAAIIGAGFIGLEVAAALRQRGLRVTVFETAPRVLSRVTCPVVSTYFQQLHRQHGVDLRTRASVTSIRTEENHLCLDIQDHAPACECDLVVLGAGAAPNDQLARSAGLDTDNGIVVDSHQRTSDPAIYAMGDCCCAPQPRCHARLRIESVQNANDQARAVAAAIAGQPVPEPPPPWFWSDQYDVKLQTVGLSADHDQQVVRGQPRPGSPFSVWYLKQQTLLAVDAVNQPRDYVLAGKLIRNAARPDPQRLADPRLDLASLMPLTTRQP